MYLPLIAIFLAISGGAGVSYMVENSHPGEALHSVKVHITEGVKRVTGSTSGEEGRLSEMVNLESDKAIGTR